MKKIMVVLICLLLAGCGNEDDDFVDAGESIIGSGSSVPDDNLEPLYIAWKASTQAQYESYWNEWQITSEIKEIDFADQDAYFILAYGSSDCPTEIGQYRFQEDALYVKLHSAGGDCTTNSAPVSYVLKTDKHDGITKLLVNQYNKEMTVDLVLE